jgi:hypothetical protein
VNRLFFALFVVVGSTSLGCRLIAGIHDIELEADSGEHDAAADAKPDGPRDAMGSDAEGGSGGSCACTGCTVLAQSQDLPLSIQMSGDTLYWLNYGSGQGAASLMSLPKTGGVPKEVAGNMTHAYGLQVDPTHLYWASVTSSGDGIIEKVPLAGGSVTTLTTGLPAPTSNFLDEGLANVPSEQFLAVNDSTLYFVAFDTCGDQGPVDSIPLTGGTATPFLVNLPNDAGVGLIQAYGLTLSGSSLFVLNISTALIAILEAPLDGGPVASAVPDLTYPLSLAISGSDILWCDDEVHFTNGFVRIASAGGSAKTLGSGLTAPWGVITDGTSAYWINNGSECGPEGSIQKAPLDGSSPAVTLVDDLLGPQAIIMDDTYLYWVDSSCGGVIRMPK